MKNLIFTFLILIFISKIIFSQVNSIIYNDNCDGNDIGRYIAINPANNWIYITGDAQCVKNSTNTGFDFYIACYDQILSTTK